MRWLVLVARIIGWLLTPLVVWAASFLGAWIATSFAGSLPSPRTGFYLTIGAGLLAGVAMTLLWMRILRSSRRLRHSLHMTAEGLPILEEALDPAPEEAPPVEAPRVEAPPA